MMKPILSLALFILLTANFNYGQFYIRDNGDSTHYNSLPKNDDPVELFIELTAGTKYVNYIDPDLGLLFGIPDSTRAIRTGQRMYALLELPEIRGNDDYISATMILKVDFKSMEELIKDKLLQNESGKPFNGNGPTIFYSATELSSINPGWKSYKVELNCNGESECTHTWVFVEGKKAWFVFILAAKKATWEERQTIFSSFLRGIRIK